MAPHRLLTGASVAAVWLGVIAAQARADLIRWDVASSVASITLPAGPAPRSDQGVIPVWSGSGYLDAGVRLNAPWGASGFGAGTFRLAELVHFYNLKPGDLGYGRSLPLAANSYTLDIALYDWDSGDLGSLSFTGHLSGTLGPPYSEVTNHLDGPATQRVRIGRHLYTVTLEADRSSHPIPLPPPDEQFRRDDGFDEGFIFMTVAPVAEAPEPGGLTLAACGLISAAAAAYRQRLTRRPRTPFPLAPAAARAMMGEAAA